MMQRVEGRIDLSNENILENVQMKLVNATECEEKYKDVPAITLMDLKAVFQVKLEGIDMSVEIPGGCEASALVDEKMMDHFDIDMEELFAAAQKNTFERNEFSMKTMSSVLAGFIGENVPEPDPTEPQLYVITNEKGFNGATVLMNPGLLQEYLRRTGKIRAYVLPSSIHEVLLVDDPHADVRDLREMVYDINRTQVAPEDRLSDSVYVLDKEGLRVA